MASVLGHYKHNFLSFVIVSARTEMNWPTHGKIEFRNVSLSYDEDADPVVNCISFTIEAGEKVQFNSLPTSVVC